MLLFPALPERLPEGHALTLVARGFGWLVIQYHVGGALYSMQAGSERRAENYAKFTEESG